VGINSVGTGSVAIDSVGVDSTGVGCVGTSSVEVGGGSGVDVETVSGGDVIVGRTARSVEDEAVTVKLSAA